MATVVLDLDILNLPHEVHGLVGYKKAYTLIRYKGRPIGNITLDVKDSTLDVSEHLDQILDAVKLTLWECEVQDFLQWDEQVIVHNELPTVTVAVCTRDRPEDLKRCLDALMKLPDIDQEYIVIDNCPSTDATKTLVASYPNIRYIHEARPGLNIARNRAIAEATGEVVAFTDDDATPDAGWLDALLANFRNPLVQCVTGLTMPLELETEAQEIFENYTPFGRGFQKKVHTATTASPLATGRIGAGANMAVRKSIFQEIGYFDEALDAGTPTHSGGDHDIFTRILIAGYTIIYEPAALSWHRHRRSLKELETTLYGYGVGVYALLTRHLTKNREWEVLLIAFNWFWHKQIRVLAKALLKRPNAIPLNLILAELKGCLAGPLAYLRSQKQLRSYEAH